MRSSLSVTRSEVMTGTAAGEAGAVDHNADVEDCIEPDDVRDADGDAVDDLDDGSRGGDGMSAVVRAVTVTVIAAERTLSAPPTMKAASSSVCVPFDSEGSGATQSKSAVDAEGVQAAPPSSDLVPST
jgi:hypothetical protein